MNIFQSLFSTTTAVHHLSPSSVDQQACPNCWGSQEYGSQYISPACLNQNTASRAASRSKKAFVMRFVETYVTGIRA